VSPERSSWTAWDSPAINNSYVISYYRPGRAARIPAGPGHSRLDRQREIARRCPCAISSTTTRESAASHGTSWWQRVRSATGHDFEEFWRLYVSGVTEIPWDDYLRPRAGRWCSPRRRTVDARIGSIPPAVQGGRWRAVAAPGSAAKARRPAQPGTKLVRINRRPVIDGTDVTAAVRTIRRSAEVVVEVVRDGSPLTIRFDAGRTIACAPSCAICTRRRRRCGASASGCSEPCDDRGARSSSS